MSADVFPDVVESRVVEYAPGKFAPVVSRDGEWIFRGGRVFGSHQAAADAAVDEVGCQKMFWGEQLADRSNAAVVNGEHFRLGSQRPSANTQMRGFGGRTFHLRDLATGEIAECSDLWRQGLIPDFARHAFPNTHEFATESGAS